MAYSDWLRAEVDKGFRPSLQGEGCGDPVHFLHRRMIIRNHVPKENASYGAERRTRIPTRRKVSP